MKRRWLTRLGIAEIGALALLWQSGRVAPLVAFERDLDPAPKRARRGAPTDPAIRAV